MSEPSIVLIGIVGTGAMGQGIAQLAACAGLSVLLYDSRQGVALQAREQIATVLARQVERGRLEAEAVERAMGNLRVVEDLRVLGGCQLVIEAIVENLEAKQALFRQLEEVVGDEAILASNTSSLSVTAIASACRDPGRVAGLHFFNPVPLMRLVEVIEGLATRTGIAERLCALVATFGHQAVRATDSPGFIVNHAGRAFGTEALRILGEGVAPVAAIDEVLREGAGFRMGPFELFDLVGLDVSLPVMESIYRQYYEEPRYRPHPLLRQMLAAGRLGRKSGQGFYRYDGAGQVPVAAPAVAPGAALPPVWLGVDDEHDRAPLLTLLQRLGAEVESGERPSGAALCLLAPLGADVSAAARRFAVDPTRSLAIDVLSDLERHRCLMACPATRAIAPAPGCAGAPNWAFPCASRTARWPPDPFAEKHTMLDAYIYAGLRTPFGRHAGALSTVRPDDLVGLLLARLAETSGFAVDDLEDVILGCTNQAGEDSRNLARNALLAAGLPARLPGQTVNRLCASGLSAVIDAARAISCGEGRLYLAGGAESMSRAPFVMAKAESAFSRTLEVFDSTIGARFANPRLVERYGNDSMPETGDNVARAFGIAREDADRFAASSQARYQAALEEGFFLGEILPVEVRAGRKGETRLVERDEHPRPQADLAALARLPALFAGGVVTAGNASGINDGAAVVLLGDRAIGEREGIRPLARILASASVGVEPRLMGIGPQQAILRALQRAGIDLDEVGLIEINEAFAPQVLACLKLLGLDYEDPRINPHGGAIALGHPLGASGARLVLTAARGLQRIERRYAVISLCVGLGQGVAMVIERCR